MAVVVPSLFQHRRHKDRKFHGPRAHFQYTQCAMLKPVKTKSGFPRNRLGLRSVDRMLTPCLPVKVDGSIDIEPPQSLRREYTVM
jgi:hypothetical protein